MTLGKTAPYAGGMSGVGNAATTAATVAQAHSQMARNVDARAPMQCRTGERKDDYHHNSIMARSHVRSYVDG